MLKAIKHRWRLALLSATLMAVAPVVSATPSLPNAYLIYRVYMPNGGASSVELPTLVFNYSDGRASKTIAPCSVPLGLTPSGLVNESQGQPACAWAFTSGGPLPAVSLNIAYPDTHAIYWVTGFTLDSALSISVEGTYPDARYMSLNVYDATLSSFTQNGLPSGLADYSIAPDPGSANPWQQYAEAGGSFEVNITSTASAGQSNTLPMPPVVAGGFKGLPPTCSGSSCPPLDQFERASLSSLFPNVDNAYISALTQPKPGNILVLRGRLPITPSGYFTNHPEPWPTAGKQLRYWSLCNNLYMQPYPVTSCVADNDMQVDANGYYTVVVSAIADRPVNATTAQGVEWLKNSTLLPYSRHMLIVRNLLPNDFPYAAQNVPMSSSPANASSVMGDYDPAVYSCSRKTFEKGGWQACAK